MMAGLAWVTGAGGLIGSHIVRAGFDQAPGWRVRALTRDQLDLCDFAAVTKAFRSDPPHLIIHCAALSQSPACEQDPDLAWRVNFQSTEHLAQLTANTRLVFFSTDLVFDGMKGNYSETDAVNPLNVYARTKVAAENAVLANPRHTVIRTSLNAGPSPGGDRGFDEQLRLAWNKQQKTRLFTDEFRCPIAAAVTARAVWEAVRLDLRGLFHVAGAERLSRWEIGVLLAGRSTEFASCLVPSSLRDYSGPPRAPDTSLNCEKIQERLSFKLPKFSDWLAAAGGLHSA